MNVWIVSQYAGSKYHGMGFRNYFIARELVDLGYKVTLFTSAYSHLFYKFPDTKGLFTEEFIDGVRFIWIKTKKYKNSTSYGRVLGLFEFIFKLKKFDINSIETPDVIITSSFSSTPFLITKNWTAKFKAKHIFEVRDLWPLTLTTLGAKSKYHPFVYFLQLIENLAYKKADKVVSVLPNAKEYMMEHGLKEAKFEYIPNGIDITEVCNEDLGINQISLPHDKFIIGYVGSIGTANALENLIDAAVRLKNDDRFLFVIIGDGSLKTEFENNIAIQKIENVKFYPRIKKDEVQSVLRKFDVLYLGWKNHDLYKYGISANKIFDYMLSKKPIIHSCNAYNDPILEANCGLSIEPENTDEIVKSIFKIYNMSLVERNKMGKNGLEYVLKNHDYKILARKYKKLIEELVSQKVF